MMEIGRLIRGVFLPLLLIFVTACGTSVDINESMARVKKYLENNKLNAASLELKNILREDATHAESRYLLGKINLRLGDTKTAQKELRRAKDAGWDEASVNLLIAEALFRQGNFQALRDEIPIKDNYSADAKAELLGLWAIAEMALGKWEDAEETVNSGLSINEKALWIMQSNIRLQLHRGDMEAVTNSISAALEVHPESHDLWMIKAGLAEKEGKLDVAGAALQKAIDLDPPGNVTFLGRQARLAQSQIWMKQGDFDKAELAVKPVLKSFPTDPLANYTLALIAFRQGDFDATEEYLSIAQRVMPEHRQSLLLYGALNYAKKDFQQAAYYLEKASAAQPDDLGAQALLGKTYLQLGQYDDAEDRLTYVSSKTPDNAELLALVGLTRLKSGKEQEGIENLRRAVAASPDDISIRGELAKAYISVGDTDSAIEELESALAGKDNALRIEAMLLLAYLRVGDYDKALELAKGLADKAPDNPIPYNFAGLAYEGKKDLESAKNSYETALKLQAGNSIALLSLARLDIQAGHKDQAQQRYQLVLEKNPNNAAAIVALAKLAVSEGDDDKALELMERARKADKKAIEPRLILSKYYLENGMAEKALAYAEEASKVAPNHAMVIFSIGRAQLGLGKQESIQTLSKLVERVPRSPNSHYYLAEAQARFGDMASTRKSLNRAIELKPDYEQALRALGNLELAAGNIQAAASVASQAKKLLPESATGYILEGDVKVVRKENAAALKAYQLALDFARTSEVVIKISKVHTLMSDKAGAKKVLMDWLSKHPDDDPVLFVLAISHLSEGKNELAIGYYEKILQHQPNNPTALNDLSWLYHLKGDQRALKMAEKAYRLSPDNPAIQDTYGWILVQSGRIESGLVALEQAASAFPESPDIRYHLAVALSKAGEKERAKQELGVALNSKQLFSERKAAEQLQKELN